jgi:hypothetical protein
MNKWMDRWVDKQMDRWMDGWMNGSQLDTEHPSSKGSHLQMVSSTALNLHESLPWGQEKLLATGSHLVNERSQEKFHLHSIYLSEPVVHTDQISI